MALNEMNVRLPAMEQVSTEQVRPQGVSKCQVQVTEGGMSANVMVNDVCIVDLQNQGRSTKVLF